MIESLDLHMLDLFQNSLASGASFVSVTLSLDREQDRLTLEIRDNGRGMDDETLAAVRRGYYSSKCARCVGLGLPLLRATAEHCNGTFAIRSRPGQGTTVTATFQWSHIDLPPFGDLAETFLSLLVTSGECRVLLLCDCETGFRLDTEDLASILGDVPRTHPDVIAFLRAFLAEKLAEASLPS